MQRVLTFIIPVRHQDNAKDWNNVRSNLAETIRSISAQQSKDWNAVIVANHGADLPALPDAFDVKRVDFPPNQFYERGAAAMEQYIEAVRIDKGRRILAGMLHAGKMGHVMLVDDDDFVSNKLVSFVAENRDKAGWYLPQGYGWTDGGKMLYLSPDFHTHCGTSHIVRSDLYNLPKTFNEASDAYVQQMLGSHRLIDEHLSRGGNPLAPLPFPGAIYRIGHAGNHSKSGGIFSKFFLKRALLKQPTDLVLYCSRLRFLNKSLREEFFG